MAVELISHQHAVGGSLLASWQKFDAAVAFVLPRPDVLLRREHVEKGPLEEAGKTFRQLVEGWINLPRRA